MINMNITGEIIELLNRCYSKELPVMIQRRECFYTKKDEHGAIHPDQTILFVQYRIDDVLLHFELHAGKCVALRISDKFGKLDLAPHHGDLIAEQIARHTSEVNNKYRELLK